VEQLKDGGRLVIPVGERYSQVLIKVIKSPAGVVTKTSIPCMFVPLIGNHGWKE
jgi:protein-L-isoaspartate(D-aspartate) O-methyltransferase